MFFQLCIISFLFQSSVKCYKLESSQQRNDDSLMSDSIIEALLHEKHEDEYESFEIVAPNITIPEAQTTYWCSVHKLPDFTDRVHGVGFESAISDENKDLIHHMEVFGCDVSDGEIPFFSGECDSHEIPPQLRRCRHVLAPWAYGAKALFYPKEAGLSFYSSRKSQYVRLEIHYNNPHHRKGVQGNSGIRFFYTDHFRKHDIGVLEAGVIYTPNMAIPPQQDSFKWPGVCPKQCTEKNRWKTTKAFVHRESDYPDQLPETPRYHYPIALSSEGINIFASQLHTHLAGRRVWTSLYRDGKKVDEIDRDDEYSTWKESIQQIHPMKNVLPGDEIIVTCDFETKERRNVTLGGSGITDEMCVTYLHYYPEANLEVCKSSVSTNALDGFFNLQSVYHGSHINSYNDVEWTPPTINQLKFLYYFAPLNVHCLKKNGDFWNGNWNQVPQIKTFR